MAGWLRIQLLNLYSLIQESRIGMTVFIIYSAVLLSFQKDFLMICYTSKILNLH